MRYNIENLSEYQLFNRELDPLNHEGEYINKKSFIKTNRFNN